MRPREVARAAHQISHRAARETRATYRGVVDEINSDGTAQIKLPSGANVKVWPSNLFDFTKGEAVVLLRYQNGFECLGPSAYQGGLGALYATP